MSGDLPTAVVSTPSDTKGSRDGSGQPTKGNYQDHCRDNGPSVARKILFVTGTGNDHMVTPLRRLNVLTFKEAGSCKMGGRPMSLSRDPMESKPILGSIHYLMLLARKHWRAKGRVQPLRGRDTDKGSECLFAQKCGRHSHCT